MYDTSVTVTVIPLRPLLGLGTASLKQRPLSLSCPTLGHVKRGVSMRRIGLPSIVVNTRGSGSGHRCEVLP